MGTQSCSASGELRRAAPETKLTKAEIGGEDELA